MTTTTLNRTAKSLRRGEATMAASMIGAFMECSETIREVICEMIAIVNSDDSDADDVDAALNTLFEALYPGKTAEIREMDDAAFETKAFKEAADDLEVEQKAFADRVRNLMEEKGVTQVELARAANITQPAVSNILNRNARPQRRTVSRFASALGVDPETLWPTTEADVEL